MIRPGQMLKEMLRSVTRKPATTRYPAVKLTMPARFRGKLKFFPEKCIGCKLCMRDCPSNAIQIRKVADKQFEAEIDCAKCMYCAQCVDVCPKKALEATAEFELAQLDRAKLVYTTRGEPPAPAAGKSEPAVATAEVPAAPKAATTPQADRATPEGPAEKKA